MFPIWLPTHRWYLLALAAVGVATLTACSPVAPLEYQVNGDSRGLGYLGIHQKLTAWELWRPDPLLNSHADVRAKQTLLVTIAAAFEHEVRPVAPCRMLRLNSVELLSLETARMPRPKGDFAEEQLATFSEIWAVTACGVNYRWHVFDHGEDVVAILIK